MGRFAESRSTARAWLKLASTHGRQSPCASPDGLAMAQRVAVWTRDQRICLARRLFEMSANIAGHWRKVAWFGY
jgi:type II secretory pathway component PulL